MADLDDVQVLVDDLAADLGRSVVVNDPSMHLLHASRHFADEDPVRVRAVLQRDPAPEVAHYVLGLGVADWPAPGVVPANPAIELWARLCVPVRHGERVVALLLVIDADATLTAAETAHIGAVADEVGARLGAREADAARADDERDRLVADLLGEDATVREAARRRLVATGLPDLPAVVVTVLDATGAGAPDVGRAMRATVAAHGRREGAVVTSVRDGRARLVQPCGHRPDADALDEAGRRLATAARRSLGPGAEIAVGLGDPATGLAQAWRSERQAVLAARGARLVARHGGVARWADVADHAVLLRLPDDALTPDLVPGPLRALVTHEAGERLRRTLEVFLDQAGSVPRTAELLHLHRTSLYYRLRQITEITGCDLDDGRQRLVLHQGLRALEVLDGR
jgi:phage tail protein X